MPYKILHNYVGPYPQGRVVSREEMLKQGIDVDRLVNIGAIEMDKDAKVTETPLPPGPHARPGDPVTKFVNVSGSGPVAPIAPQTQHQQQHQPLQATEEPVQQATRQVDDYDNQTIKVLKDEALKRGVPGIETSWRKEDFIAALREYDAQ